MREVREIHTRYKIKLETVDNDVNTITEPKKVSYAI